jgi:hypothetical protein
MRAQEAIDKIKEDVELVGETGGSIKRRLETGERIISLMKSLEDINRDCFDLPPDLFSKARALRDYVKETPFPSEDDVGRDIKEIERFLKVVIKDACR